MKYGSINLKLLNYISNSVVINFIDLYVFQVETRDTKMRGLLRVLMKSAAAFDLMLDASHESVQWVVFRVAVVGISHGSWRPRGGLVGCITVQTISNILLSKISVHDHTVQYNLLQNVFGCRCIDKNKGHAYKKCSINFLTRLQSLVFSWLDHNHMLLHAGHCWWLRWGCDSRVYWGWQWEVAGQSQAASQWSYQTQTHGLGCCCSSFIYVKKY